MQSPHKAAFFFACFALKKSVQWNFLLKKTGVAITQRSFCKNKIQKFVYETFYYFDLQVNILIFILSKLKYYGKYVA